MLRPILNSGIAKHIQELFQSLYDSIFANPNNLQNHDGTVLNEDLDEQCHGFEHCNEQEERRETRRDKSCASRYLQNLTRLVTHRVQAIQRALPRLGRRSRRRQIRAQIMTHEIRHQLWNLPCGLRLDQLTVDELKQQGQQLTSLRDSNKA